MTISFTTGQLVHVPFRVSWNNTKPVEEDTVHVLCTILNHKVSFGHLRYEITPVQGEGRA